MAQKEISNSVLSLLRDKADFYRAPTNLNKYLWNSRYCFRLNRAEKRYTLSFKHFDTVRLSDSETFEGMKSSIKNMEGHSGIEMKLEEFQKKVPNLRALKN